VRIGNTFDGFVAALFGGQLYNYLIKVLIGKAKSRGGFP
jgi:hypothetical protein